MAWTFPGMDPFIEGQGLWEDFHHDLISEIKADLVRRLPERYVVRTGERAYIVLVPRGAELVSQEFREGFLEIRTLGLERQLVTCIEILSPSNKRPGTEGWELYQRKRQAFFLGSAHFVEIDLLRGGQRMAMYEAWPDSPYYLLVSRMERAPYGEVWPANFRQPLPEIPIPLTRPDPDVRLALQPLVEAVYFRSRYEQDIDYRQLPRPPLAPEDAAWLEERLRGG
jgi:hypothetical protein